MSITVTLTVFCKDHPKYKGTRRPRVNLCVPCDDVYDIRHPQSYWDCQVEKVEVKDNG